MTQQHHAISYLFLMTCGIFWFALYILKLEESSETLIRTWEIPSSSQQCVINPWICQGQRTPGSGFGTPDSMICSARSLLELTKCFPRILLLQPSLYLQFRNALSIIHGKKCRATPRRIECSDRNEGRAKRRRNTPDKRATPKKRQVEGGSNVGVLLSGSSARAGREPTLRGSAPPQTGPTTRSNRFETIWNCQD